MDYETAVKGWIELKKEGPHKEDVVELLKNEVSQSKVICEEDKLALEQLFDSILHTERYGNSSEVEEVYDILRKYEGFAKEFTRIVMRANGNH